jgi:hypothetical protein
MWSFERRVALLAARDTWSFLKSRTGSACLALVSLLIGSVIQYGRYGLDAMLPELEVWFSYVLIGACASVLLIFLCT